MEHATYSPSTITPPHDTMRKLVRFTRTDGNRTTWPTCMDRLGSDSTHVAQFLEKLANYLVEYLNYPGK